MFTFLSLASPLKWGKKAHFVQTFASKGFINWLTQTTAEIQKTSIQFLRINPEAGTDIHLGRLVDLPIVEELKDAYLTYAMSVIVSRCVSRRSRRA